MKVTFLLLTFLLLYNIHSINSECQFIELHPKDSTSLRVRSPSQFCIYQDITSMSYNSEGVLTFLISHGILMNNHIKHFNANFIHLPQQTSLSENIFPLEKDPNKIYFPIESAYENAYDNSFNTMNHIYFVKENINDDGTFKSYLLIYLKIDIESTDSNSYYEINILPPIFTSDISTIDLAGEKPIQLSSVGFTLSTHVPIYTHVHYSDEIIKNNYLLFSKGKLFTYTCGSFILKKENAYVINPNRHYGYLIDFKSLNSNSRVCSSLLIKFVISDNLDYDIQLKIEHLNLPFVNLPVFDMYQTSYSVNMEINDVVNQHTLLGVFPKEKITDSKYYLLGKYFFGIGDVFYKSSNNLEDINELHAPSIPDYIHYSNSSFLIELVNIEYDLNILHVKCETYCLIHFEIFEIFNDHIEEKEDPREFSLDLEFPGVYFFRLNKDKIHNIYFVNIPRFTYELENLNGEQIDGMIEYDKFVLDNQKNIRQDLIDFSGDVETTYVKLKLVAHLNNALMKLKLNIWEDIEEIKINTHNTHNIGNYSYTYKTFLFKFPLDDKIYDSYQIQIINKDDKNPNIKSPISLYSYFDLGYREHFILPSAYNSHIDYLSEPTYKFTAEISNPYDRPYSIIPKSNKEVFYYYAVRFHNYDKESKVFIAFTGAEKPNYMYLTQDSMITIDVNVENENNYLLYKGGKYRDSSLVVNFYKCDQNVDNISFEITQLNNKTIASGSIKDHQQRSLSKDIGIDYIIKFHAKYHSKIMMYYSYESNSNLLELKESNSSTIEYKLSNSKNMNSLFVKFKPYLTIGGKISYFIYLIPFNDDNKDKCSFISRSSIVSLLQEDNDGSIINATIFGIEPGLYWLQVVGQETHNYHSFKIYDKVLIKVTAYSYIMLVMIKMIIVILSIFSLMMSIFKFKTQGNNTKKKSLHIKAYNKEENNNSIQLEEK